MNKCPGLVSGSKAVPDCGPTLVVGGTDRQRSPGVGIDAEATGIRQQKVEIARGRVAFAKARRIPPRIP